MAGDTRSARLTGVRRPDLPAEEVHVEGIHFDDVAWSFRSPETGEYVVTEAGYQRTTFVLSGRDHHEPSVPRHARAVGVTA